MDNLEVKIKLCTLVKLLEETIGEANHFSIPKGSIGCIVESYANPEAHQVDFDLFEADDPYKISNDTALLYPHQFEVVDKNNLQSQTLQ